MERSSEILGLAKEVGVREAVAGCVVDEDSGGADIDSGGG